MDVGTFMQFALCHPQYGYYMTRDPFGRAGDFTTAPEISQMFGEMIGAWVVDVWRKMGGPTEFSLVEAGPGRGILMADMLRIANRIEGFAAAAKIYLMEASPALMEKQREALSQHNITWISAIGDVPKNVTAIIIGNEFLDALPVRQFLLEKGRWSERVIAYNAQQEILTFDFAAADPPLPFAAEEGLYEISESRSSFVQECCALIGGDKGAALFIDYGHAHAAPGDTLQAVKGHTYWNVLNNIGEADVTSHVDFGALMQEISLQKDFGCHFAHQGAFLRELGIEARAAQLRAKDAAVDTALARLTGKDQMGDLFKVLCFHAGLSQAPEGFAA
jgi:NADH dehydrogenase [ubiquinone] 1 alpha subcomplex assembly factor 7